MGRPAPFSDSLLRCGEKWGIQGTPPYKKTEFFVRNSAFLAALQQNRAPNLGGPGAS